MSSDPGEAARLAAKYGGMDRNAKREAARLAAKYGADQGQPAASMNAAYEAMIASQLVAIGERDWLIHQIAGRPRFSLESIGTESGPGPRRVAYFRYLREGHIVTVRVEDER